MEVLAILVAAGRGERMQAALPKAFLPLAGRPLLRWAAEALEASGTVAGFVAVVPEVLRTDARDVLAGLPKLRAVVAGGARRQDSVEAGLLALPTGFEGVVLVHDAARPLVSSEIIAAVAQAAGEYGAALPVVPLVDTVKRVRDGRVEGTLDRNELFAAQTPQGFLLPVLTRAYAEAAAAGITLTDEAMAVERLGLPVIAVPGSPRNRKLTTPDDLRWAQRLLESEHIAAPADTLAPQASRG